MRQLYAALPRTGLTVSARSTFADNVIIMAACLLPYFVYRYVTVTPVECYSFTAGVSLVWSVFVTATFTKFFRVIAQSMRHAGHETDEDNTRSVLERAGAFFVGLYTSDVKTVLVAGAACLVQTAIGVLTTGARTALATGVCEPLPPLAWTVSATVIYTALATGTSAMLAEHCRVRSVTWLAVTVFTSTFLFSVLGIVMHVKQRSLGGLPPDWSAAYFMFSFAIYAQFFHFAVPALAADSGVWHKWLYGLLARLGESGAGCCRPRGPVGAGGGSDDGRSSDDDCDHASHDEHDEEAGEARTSGAPPTVGMTTRLVTPSAAAAYGATVAYIGRPPDALELRLARLRHRRRPYELRNPPDARFLRMSVEDVTGDVMRANRAEAIFRRTGVEGYYAVFRSMCALLDADVVAPAQLAGALQAARKLARETRVVWHRSAYAPWTASGHADDLTVATEGAEDDDPIFDRVAEGYDIGAHGAHGAHDSRDSGDASAGTRSTHADQLETTTPAPLPDNETLAQHRARVYPALAYLQAVLKASLEFDAESVVHGALAAPAPQARAMVGATSSAVLATLFHGRD